MSARLTLPLGLLATPWWSQQLQIVLDTRLFESRSSNVTQPRKTGPSAKTSSPQTTSSSKPTQHKLPSFSSFFFLLVCGSKIGPSVSGKSATGFVHNVLSKNRVTFVAFDETPTHKPSTFPTLSSAVHSPSIHSLPSTPFHPLPSFPSIFASSTQFGGGGGGLNLCFVAVCINQDAPWVPWPFRCRALQTPSQAAHTFAPCHDARGAAATASCLHCTHPHGRSCCGLSIIKRSACACAMEPAQHDSAHTDPAALTARADWPA